MFVCGPWPFGSDRRNLAKILKAGGWECRPLQPQYHVPGGLMWSIQAVLDPPSNVLSMQHGQVVISAQDDKSAAPEPAPCVVGQAKTVQLCLASDTAAHDPWLTHDPWSRAIAAAPAAQTAQPAAHVIHELEQRLEQTILAKLPVAPEHMEVDDQEHRLQALEQQMHALSGRQTSLESTVNDNHAQSAAQVQSLQQQMLVQMDTQSKQMQAMLSDQMIRLESILSKKPRTEWRGGGPTAEPKHRASPRFCRPLRAIFYLIFASLMFRIGEARVPGPEVAPTWSIGICNPSGLQAKHHIVGDIKSTVLAVSETHLTKGSKRHLQSSLRSMRSDFKQVLTGAPMSPRTTSDAGGWAGVAYLSTVPCRTMATPWPPDLYESGRIQFASFCTSSSWVSGSVVYGFPEGKTHPRAFEQTERMLDFAFDHMQSIPGPRFMCGDWNFTLDSLTVSSRLQDSGWVEVQDLQHMRTGAPIRPTCKQVSRKDFLWLSPELALAFRGLRFCDETFADHSLLLADFVGGAKQIERFPWPCPKPIDWNGVPPLSSPVSFAAPADPTSQYADLWRQREEQAKAALAPDWIPSMQGRGQQTKPSKITGHQAPLRQGKSSEVQPSFFGFSALHAKQFRQLRRLQNYCRWIDNKQRLGSNDPLHGFGLWTSILKAPGFSPSFAGWWHHRQFTSPLDPVDIPQFCPPSNVAHQIFDAVLAEVRLFESRLNAARSAHRKSQHEQDRALIFREVARPAAAPVESLVHSLAATVDAVDDQECAVILDKPVDILPSHPVWIAGQAKQVIHAEHDKIWVDDVESLAKLVLSWSSDSLWETFRRFLMRSMNSGRLVGVAMTMSRSHTGMSWLGLLGVPCVLVPCHTCPLGQTCFCLNVSGKRRDPPLDLMALVGWICCMETLVPPKASLPFCNVLNLMDAGHGNFWQARCTHLPKLKVLRALGISGLSLSLVCPTAFGPVSSHGICSSKLKLGRMMGCLEIDRDARLLTSGTIWCFRLSRPTLPAMSYVERRLTLRNASIASPVTQRCALPFWLEFHIRWQRLGLGPWLACAGISKCVTPTPLVSILPLDLLKGVVWVSLACCWSIMSFPAGCVLNCLTSGCCPTLMIGRPTPGTQTMLSDSWMLWSSLPLCWTWQLTARKPLVGPPMVRCAKPCVQQVYRFYIKLASSVDILGFPDVGPIAPLFSDLGHSMTSGRSWPPAKPNLLPKFGCSAPLPGLGVCMLSPVLRLVIIIGWTCVARPLKQLGIKGPVLIPICCLDCLSQMQTPSLLPFCGLVAPCASNVMKTFGRLVLRLMPLGTWTCPLMHSLSLCNRDLCKLDCLCVLMALFLTNLGASMSIRPTSPRLNTVCIGLGLALSHPRFSIAMSSMDCGRLMLPPLVAPLPSWAVMTRLSAASVWPDHCLLKVTNRNGQTRLLIALGAAKLTTYVTATGSAPSMPTWENPLLRTCCPCWTPFLRHLPCVVGRCYPLLGLVGFVPCSVCRRTSLCPLVDIAGHVESCFHWWLLPSLCWAEVSPCLMVCCPCPWLWSTVDSWPGLRPLCLIPSGFVSNCLPLRTLCCCVCVTLGSGFPGAGGHLDRLSQCHVEVLHLFLGQSPHQCQQASFRLVAVDCPLGYGSGCGEYQIA